MKDEVLHALCKKHENNPTYDIQLDAVKKLLSHYGYSAVGMGYRLTHEFSETPNMYLVPCTDLYAKLPVVLVYDLHRKQFFFYSVILFDAFSRMRFTNDYRTEVNILQELIGIITDLDLVGWSFKGAHFSFNKKHNFNDISFGALTLFRFHADVKCPKVVLGVEYMDDIYGIELGNILHTRLAVYQNNPSETENLLSVERDFTGIYELAVGCIPRLSNLRKRGCYNDYSYTTDLQHTAMPRVPRQADAFSLRWIVSCCGAN